jgi:chemotaxis protein MotA
VLTRSTALNKSSASGLVLALFVFLTIALTSTKNPAVFLDWHAGLIVLGGTAAAAMLSFSAKNIVQLSKVFASRVLKSTQKQYSEVIQEMVDLAANYRNDDNYLTKALPNIKTPFLKEAVALTIEGGLTENEIEMILVKRAATHFKRYEEDANMFTTLAKFPPAFGLLGAVVGMVGLMESLGGADAIKNVGPKMAVALVATLYGIAVANFIFIPIGENLSKFNRQDKITRQMIIDGMKMIRAKKHPLLVEENIKSYLLPSERDGIKKTTSGPGSAKKAA